MGPGLLSKFQKAFFAFSIRNRISPENKTLGSSYFKKAGKKAEKKASHLSSLVLTENSVKICWCFNVHLAMISWYNFFRSDSVYPKIWPQNHALFHNLFEELWRNIIMSAKLWKIFKYLKTWGEMKSCSYCHSLSDFGFWHYTK